MRQEQYDAAQTLRILADLIEKGTLRRAQVSVHNDDGPYSVKQRATVLDDGGREAILIIDLKHEVGLDKALEPFRLQQFDQRIGQVDRLKTHLRDESHELSAEERREAAGLLEAFLNQVRQRIVNDGGADNVKDA